MNKVGKMLGWNINQILSLDVVKRSDKADKTIPFLPQATIKFR